MFTNKGSDTRFLFKAYFLALKKLHVDTWTIKNKNKANKQKTQQLSSHAEYRALEAKRKTSVAISRFRIKL